MLLRVLIQQLHTIFINQSSHHHREKQALMDGSTVKHRRYDTVSSAAPATEHTRTPRISQCSSACERASEVQPRVKVATRVNGRAKFKNTKTTPKVHLYMPSEIDITCGRYSACLTHRRCRHRPRWCRHRSSPGSHAASAPWPQTLARLHFARLSGGGCEVGEYQRDDWLYVWVVIKMKPLNWLYE